MEKCCKGCDTCEFCHEMGWCLDKTMYDAKGETDMQDEDDLTADDSVICLPKIGKGGNVFNEPLDDNVLEIVRHVIK